MSHTILGQYSPANSSHVVPAQLVVDPQSYVLLVAQTTDEPHNMFEQQQGLLKHLTISDRIGSIPRTICCTDGSVFNTQDNDAIDEYLCHHQSLGIFKRLLVCLETNWCWVSIASAVTILLIGLFLVYGLPFFSKQVARLIPDHIYQIVGVGSLKFLDENMLKPSKLDKAKQEAIRSRITQKLAEHDQVYRLNFRLMSYGDVGYGLANAFALPSGDIIVTDGLVQLAESDDELDAVILHEMGHIVNQHSMQYIVRSSVLATLLVMFTSEVSFLSDWLIALPVFFIETGYSREFEREADRYAMERMIQLGVDPKYFGQMMARLLYLNDDQAIIESNDKSLGEMASSYMSTHPAGEDRIKMGKQYSQCFHNEQLCQR